MYSLAILYLIDQLCSLNLYVNNLSFTYFLADFEREIKI